jgi:hypothetical protein
MSLKKMLGIIAGGITAYKFFSLANRRNSHQDVTAISSQTNQSEIHDMDKHARNNSEVEKYIAAEAVSSGRVRSVLIVLITASILSFSAAWNAQGTWLDKRIEIRRAALNLFNETWRNRISEEDRELFQRAQIFLETRGLDIHNNDHKSLLVDEIKELEKKRRERDTVHVPFFGIEVDTNDMALFSGFTFVIGLLWLRFSLLRELRNLRLVFLRAKESGELRLCYELLAMQQVLTNPPVYSQDKYKTWNFIPKLLFALPLIIDIIQIRDVLTFLDIGTLLDPKQKFVFLIECAFLIMITVLTLQCIYTSIKIDRAWRGAASDIKNQV